MNPGRQDDAARLPPLEPGERLNQQTFHRRYEAMPPGTRAELIGGIVYIPAPLKPKHGRMRARLTGWLVDYEAGTPGVETYGSTTVILGEESEPQPDAYLIVAPDRGGQMHYNIDEYLVGAPELVAEVALSTGSIDLHAKRRDYEAAGVREYLVIALRQQRVFWFVARAGRFEDLAPGPDGVLRSAVFPGLWLDPSALLARDFARVGTVLRQGIASPEHAAFVAQLATSRNNEAP